MNQKPDEHIMLYLGAAYGDGAKFCTINLWFHNGAPEKAKKVRADLPFIED